MVTSLPMTAVLVLVMTSAAGCSWTDGDTATPEPPVVASTTDGGGAAIDDNGEADDRPATDGKPGDAGKTTSTSRKSSRVVKWLHNFTPTGGGGTTAEAAYTNFMQKNCWNTLSLAREDSPSETSEPMDEPLRSLYEGAAAACLAAFEGQSDLWTTAHARLADIDASGLDCWDRSVYEILDTLVNAHEADPSVEFTYGKKGSDGCPTLTELSPDNGPREGGYQVEVRGRNLPATLELLWNFDQTITAYREHMGGPLILTIPPSESEDSNVTVKISGAYRIEPVYAGFRYTD